MVAVVDLTDLDDHADKLMRHDNTIRARLAEVLSCSPGSAVLIQVGRLPAAITAAAPGLWRQLVRRYVVDVRCAPSGAASWRQALGELAGVAQ